MVNAADLLALAQARRGHFRMESGYHAEHWFELDRLFEQREKLGPFVRELAQRLSGHGVEVVCGPERGGAKLAALLARELDVAACSAERHEPATHEGFFAVKYTIPEPQRAALRGKRVAIVDDAISAGSAVRGTHADLLASGALPVALGALFVFGERAAAFAHENALALEGVVAMGFSMWKPDECPLCRRGVPLEIVSDSPNVP
jgi:orotate phosphoribosyltransferase